MVITSNFTSARYIWSFWGCKIRRRPNKPMLFVCSRLHASRMVKPKRHEKAVTLSVSSRKPGGDIGGIAASSCVSTISRIFLTVACNFP
uniref:Uncharacterized protein n=1 Tax=Zea mays TaxID=4577 RepID=C4J325_MAIZE|nr:unknown [Zea mays]